MFHMTLAIRLMFNDVIVLRRAQDKLTSAAISSKRKLGIASTVRKTGFSQ